MSTGATVEQRGVRGSSTRLSPCRQRFGRNRFDEQEHPAARASAVELGIAKGDIVADLGRDRGTLRVLFITQLLLVLFLALLFAGVAAAGLVISLGMLGGGFAPTDLGDVAAVLAGGSTSLLGYGTVRMLMRFDRLGRDWIAEERKLTRTRNLVRMGDDKSALRDLLADYCAAGASPPSAREETAPGSLRSFVGVAEAPAPGRMSGCAAAVR